MLKEQHGKEAGAYRSLKTIFWLLLWQSRVGRKFDNWKL